MLLFIRWQCAQFISMVQQKKSSTHYFWWFLTHYFSLSTLCFQHYFPLLLLLSCYSHAPCGQQQKWTEALPSNSFIPRDRRKMLVCDWSSVEEKEGGSRCVLPASVALATCFFFNNCELKCYLNYFHWDWLKIGLRTINFDLNRFILLTALPSRLRHFYHIFSYFSVIF